MILLLLETVLLMGGVLARFVMMMVIVLHITATVMRMTLGVLDGGTLDTRIVPRAGGRLLVPILGATSLRSICLENGLSSLAVMMAVLSTMLGRMTAAKNKIVEIPTARDAADFLVFVGG